MKLWYSIWHKKYDCCLVLHMQATSVVLSSFYSMAVFYITFDKRYRNLETNDAQTVTQQCIDILHIYCMLMHIHIHKCVFYPCTRFSLVCLRIILTQNFLLPGIAWLVQLTLRVMDNYSHLLMSRGMLVYCVICQYEVHYYL